MTSIDWLHLSLEAKETDLRIKDVPESELWEIPNLGEFRVRLVNSGGIAVGNLNRGSEIDKTENVP